MVRTKNIYDKPSPEDGHRLLVMRKWPRGITKGSVDEWIRELGPSEMLLSLWRKGQLRWEEFAARYRGEMGENNEAVEAVRRLAEGKTITLLCGCRDESRCHRTVLKAIIEGDGIPRPVGGIH